MVPAPGGGMLRERAADAAAAAALSLRSHRLLTPELDSVANSSVGLMGC